MRKIGLPIFAAALALSAAAPGAAQHQPLLIDPPGPYIHRGSGFIFPTASGPFKRTRLIEYDVDATDVSAAYDVYEKGRESALTIYVYPAPPTTASTDAEAAKLERDAVCQGEFEGVKSNVAGRHADVKLVHEGSIATPSPHFAGSGLDVLFEFSAEFRGKQQMVRSEAILYCYFGGKWLVKYRLTAPLTVDLKGKWQS